MLKIGIENNWDFLRRSCQAIILAGLGIYLWLQIGLGKDTTEMNFIMIGYLSILTLFGIAVKEASDQLYLYSYKRNGLSVIDKTRRVNNEATE